MRWRVLQAMARRANKFCKRLILKVRTRPEARMNLIKESSQLMNFRARLIKWLAQRRMAPMSNNMQTTRPSETFTKVTERLKTLIVHYHVSLVKMIVQMIPLSGTKLQRCSSLVLTRKVHRWGRDLLLLKLAFASSKCDWETLKPHDKSLTAKS